MRAAISRARAPGKANDTESAASGRCGNGDDGVGEVQLRGRRAAHCGDADVRPVRPAAAIASGIPPVRRRKGRRAARKAGGGGSGRLAMPAGYTTTCRYPPEPLDSLRNSVSFRSARWITRRSRLFMGLKRKGWPVRFTLSAAAAALMRSSSMRSAR